MCELCLMLKFVSSLWTMRMIAVVEPDRSCVVSVTSSPLHIAAAAAAGVDSWSRQSNVIGCGTKTQPWMVESLYHSR